MIRAAELVWRDGGPYSTAFGDIYHDPDGSAEVERIFLEPAGFDDLLRRERSLLVGELGFGTGLNFAVVARRCLAAHVPLHFLSFEAFPVAPEDFGNLARQRMSREPVYETLLPCYPPLLPGWHQRRLYGGRVILSIYYGNAEEGLGDLRTQLGQPFHLWLLDGFAPDRNPDMWRESLLRDVGATAARGTRVSTFTAAGRVRRALTEAGFHMRRVDQRPHKRESLAGTFTGTGLAPRGRPARVTVVGAGIAGAAIARTLAESGSTVTVLERAAAPATGASSVPATVMHPRLQHQHDAQANLRATAWAHALAAVRCYVDDPESGVRATGALQLPSANYPAERLHAVAARYADTGLDIRLISGAEAAGICGLPGLASTDPVLWFPDACLVDTPRFTRTLLHHPEIEVRTGVSNENWPDGTAVLACGSAARNFPGAAFLEIGGIYGQLDLIRPETAPAGRLSLPLLGRGYVTPLPAGDEDAVLAVGATYEHAPWPVQRATRANLDHLTALASAPGRPVAAVKAERTVSSDRNPVIGTLYDLDETPCEARLVSVGHGSMGTVSAHLGASLIAGRLGIGLVPLAAPSRALVSPLRFRRRQARRGYRFGAAP